METRDTIVALLTRMGIIMEDLSTDCICAGHASPEEIDGLLNRCGTAIEQLTDLLAAARTAQRDC